MLLLTITMQEDCFSFFTGREDKNVPSDVIRVMCPNLKCRAILSVPSSARGKTVRCRQCGARVRIPEPPINAADADKHAETSAGAGKTQT